MAMIIFYCMDNVTFIVYVMIFVTFIFTIYIHFQLKIKVVVNARQLFVFIFMIIATSQVIRLYGVTYGNIIYK